jgi:hypothetical protein
MHCLASATASSSAMPGNVPEIVAQADRAAAAIATTAFPQERLVPAM